MTRMMIIDNSKESRLLMKDFLLAHNHKIVAEASDDVAAIQKYLSEKPDIIFLDLTMPEFGLRILKKIRFHDPTSKIIAITNNDDVKIFEECTNLGVLAFVIKPIDLNDVLSAISFSNEIT